MVTTIHREQIPAKHIRRLSNEFRMDLTGLCKVTQQLVVRSLSLQRQKLFPRWCLSEVEPGIFTGPSHLSVIDAAANYCMRNLDQELRLEEKFRLEIEKYLYTKQPGKLLESIAQYSSIIFNIDIAPALLRKSLVNIPNEQAVYNLMLSSTKPTYQEKINLELNGLAEEILSGREPSISYFINYFGFLERRDIIPCRLENREYILELLRNRILGQPSYSEERYELFRHYSSISQSLASAYTDVLSKIEDKENFRKSFIAVRSCIEYQNNNRLLKARGFKFLGDLLTAKGLDLKLASIEDLDA